MPLRLPVLSLLLSLIAVSGTAAEAAPLRLMVRPEVRHQTIEGFGSSINAWTAPHYQLYYNDAFTEFAANELGMSIFRLQMWGGVSPHEITDPREIRYQDFRWTGEGLRGKMNVDWARRLVAANPEVRIIGSIWSAPAWMKVNGSRTGTRAGYLHDPKRDYDHDNRLRDDRYEHFAQWVVEWTRYMESQGTPFYAISLQNELVFTQWFESTLYTPEQYARLVRITGERFEAEGVRKPLFFGPEDMTMATYRDEQRHRPFIDALLQPDVAKYFDVFATHGYSDGVRGDGRNTPVGYWESVKSFGRPYWITEGGTGRHTWPSPVARGVGPQLHVALTRANVSLFTGWQLTSNPGRASEHDFMDWDQPTKKTYTAMHFWRHIRPGAVRVEVEVEESSGLLASAYVHDRRGERVLVVLNPQAEDRTIQLDWPESGGGSWQAFQTSERLSHEAVVVQAAANGTLELTLPGHSITTVIQAKPKGE